MKKCIICQNWIPDDAKRCETCGFPARRWFLSKHHYASWMEQTVIPYRKQWEDKQKNNRTNMNKQIDFDWIVSSFGAKAALEHYSEINHTLSNTNDISNKNDILNRLIARADDYGFDLNLFENISLQNKSEIIKWLNQNGYRYREGRLDSEDWHIEVETKITFNSSLGFDHPPIAVIMRTTEGYSVFCDYNCEFCEDLQLADFLRKTMRKLHVCDDNDHYHDEQNIFCVGNRTISRTAKYQVRNSAEIENDISCIPPFLNFDPSIGKKTVLKWLDNHGYLYHRYQYSDSEYDKGKYSIALDDWDAEYSSDFEYWYFAKDVENPQDYYQAMSDQLDKAGFHFEEEIREIEEIQKIYTKEEQEIHIVCDFEIKLFWIWIH